MLPWQRHVSQLNYQKTKFVLLTFGDQRIKGFRETQKLCSATLNFAKRCASYILLIEMRRHRAVF